MFIHSGDAHFQVHQSLPTWGSSNVITNLAAQSKISSVLSPLGTSVENDNRLDGNLYASDFTANYENKFKREASLPKNVPLDEDLNLMLPSLTGDDEHNLIDIDFPMCDDTSYTGLEPVPLYYERLTSFVSHADVQNLLLAIDATLCDFMGVDHELNPEKHQIKGVWSGPELNEGLCKFVIKIYRKSENEILCEFQRRSGCSLVFNDFYEKVIEEVIEFVDRRDQYANETNQGVREWLEKLSEDESYDSDLSPPDYSLESFDDDDIKALCDMSSCDAIEAMQQRLSILASLPEETLEEVGRGVYDELVQIIQKSFNSTDHTIVDRACVFLANLCTQEELRDDVVKMLLTDMFDILEQPGSVQNQNSKRHIAKSLSLLSETHVSEIMETEGSENYRQILKTECSNESDYNQILSSTLRAITQY